MKRLIAFILVLGLLAGAAWVVYDQFAPLPGSSPVSTPLGLEIRIDVTRDTWVSSFPDEQSANLGGADRLKFKGSGEFAIVDLGVDAIKGRIIRKATLHLHTLGSNPLRRVTVSTLASDWHEGTRRWYAHEAGSSTYLAAAQDRTAWSYPGSDITTVTLGLGQTRWRFADASDADANGYQAIEVDPSIIAARIAGVSHGFVIFDDVGSEWERDGEKFIWRFLPDRFVASREASRRKRPYFTVVFGDRDDTPPGQTTDIQSDATGLPEGETQVSWLTPDDASGAGVIGYIVRVAQGDRFDWPTAHQVSNDLVPLAKGKGERVTMHLRDLSGDLKGKATIGIRAVDGAGNAGPVSLGNIHISESPRSATIEGESLKVFPAVSAQIPLPAAGGVQLAIIDALDKVHPVTGRIIPMHDSGYLRANHLWSAADRQLALHAARNEFVTFQVLLQGRAENAILQVEWDGDAASTIQSRLYRARHVATTNGPLPDPLIEMRADEGSHIPAKDDGLGGKQQYGSYFVQIYVPHTAKNGRHTGSLHLTHGGERLSIPIDLRVWNFTLPDHLSFVPQMNCYGLPAPPQEVAYYRLAHEHRTCLNRVPYSWQGKPGHGLAPLVVRENSAIDLRFREYDARFGPLLDGTAFADLPRAGVPVDAFYLPLNENWPADVNKAFRGGYWADEALGPEYWREFEEASAKFASHIQTQGWYSTIFEFYLNNKVLHKQQGWSVSSAHWLYDEPMNTQDFWALRCFGQAFNRGVARGLDRTQSLLPMLAFRCDISRPQWQRDLLDGVMGVNVVGGSFHRHARTVLDRKREHGEITYMYGGNNAIDANNTHAAAWCLDAWCAGLDGVLPWQTVGNAQSWKQADTLSLFYPGSETGSDKPIPSLRLKAYTRGQQDVEYLVLFAQATGQSRHAVGTKARELLGMRATFSQSSADDAGQVTFGDLDGVALWKLRTRIGALLDGAAPQPRRKLIDLRPPLRE